MKFQTPLKVVPLTFTITPILKKHTSGYTHRRSCEKTSRLWKSKARTTDPFWCRICSNCCQMCFHQILTLVCEDIRNHGMFLLLLLLIQKMWSRFCRSVGKTSNLIPFLDNILMQQNVTTVQGVCRLSVGNVGLSRYLITVY